MSAPEGVSATPQSAANVTPAGDRTPANQPPAVIAPQIAAAQRERWWWTRRKRVAVPSFLGQPLRHVIEEAGTTGLVVNVVGNGLAREQAPPPGTMVPAGTAVVVRFSR